VLFRSGEIFFPSENLLLADGGKAMLIGKV
jgi:hypothetical protein